MNSSLNYLNNKAQKLFVWLLPLVDNILSTCLAILKRKESSFEWWGQRLLSGILVPLFFFLFIIVITSFSYEKMTIMSFFSMISDTYTFFIVLMTLVLGWHIQHGMCEVITDYVHRERLKIMCIFMIRVAVIECCKFVYFICVIF